MKHIVSFSGGKDSTAMLLMMVEKGMPIDDIIFCDTGVEFHAMYDHIKQVEKLIKRPITILREPHGFEYWLLYHMCNSRYGEDNGKTHRIKGRSWPRARARWCTRTLKTDPINKYIKDNYNGEDVKQYIGIAYDEPKRHKNIPANVQHPLYDWQITEKQALEYCYAKGFTWGGLYEIFNRVSCWLCPLQGIGELRKLRKHFPELWGKLLYWDEQTRTDFKIGCSVKELEERFAREDRIEKLKAEIEIPLF